MAAISQQAIFSDAFFVNEKRCKLNKIPLKLIPYGLIDNNPALVQIMVWRLIGYTPLSEPILTQFTDAYVRPLGEMSQTHYVAQQYVHKWSHYRHINGFVNKIIWYKIVQNCWEWYGGARMLLSLKYHSSIMNSHAIYVFICITSMLSKMLYQKPLLLTWINVNPSKDK